MRAVGPKLTLAEKAQLWRRWKEGQSLREIGEALGGRQSAVTAQIYRRGGIAPVQRYRSIRALNLEEREEISRGLCLGA